MFIATGASPAIPDIRGLKEVDYLTSTSALELKEVPKRLAVIGSGYIAMVLGQLFHHFGTEVDALPRALVNRETTGVFKLVADAKSQKILGVHIVAENAGDVIYPATLAVKFGLTVDDLRDSLPLY